MWLSLHTDHLAEAPNPAPEGTLGVKPPRRAPHSCFSDLSEVSLSASLPWELLFLLPPSHPTDMVNLHPFLGLQTCAHFLLKPRFLWKWQESTQVTPSPSTGTGTPRSHRRVSSSAAPRKPHGSQSAPRGSYTLRSELSTPGGRDRTECLVVVGGVARQPEQRGPQLFTPLIHDLKNTACYIKPSVSAL